MSETAETVVSSTELKQKLGAILRRVYLKGEHVTIKRDGFPVAVLLSLTEYRRLCAGDDIAQSENA